MADPALTPDQHRAALLGAARQSAAVTFDMLEHHRDLTESERIDRFPNETCEMLAEVLTVALDLENSAMDAAIAGAKSEQAASALREQLQMNNQLLGALARYIEGWA